MLQQLLDSPMVTSSNPGVLVYNVLQLLIIFSMYQTEMKSAMPYSKFAEAAQKQKKEKTFPSKQGMLIIYAPAFISSAIYLSLSSTDSLTHYQPHVAAWMVLVHFLKRTLEVLFLHKYSGSTAADVAKTIGFSYALWAVMICGTANPNPSYYSCLFGGLLFLIGTAGNLYHHSLLASLRSNVRDKQNKYSAPNGGLFEYVAAPHYLFELIGWAGIAIASEELTAYLTFAAMAGYLIARSCNQNKWNKEKFSEKEWPASRKNLIPLVF